MFRNYPLTWLFILATACVDLAIFAGPSATTERDEVLRFCLLNFGFPAQLSVLSIWAVMSRLNRLAKGAVLTFLLGVLLLLASATLETLNIRREFIAVSLLQSLVILGGAWVLKWCGYQAELDCVTSPSPEPFRISLVEVFGWSLVVALWSFAARHADFSIVAEYDWWLWFSCATLVPLAMIPAFLAKLQTGTRMLRLMVVYLLALLFYGLARKFFPGELQAWIFTMAVTQIAYLTAWWAVMRMDQVLRERRAVSANSRAKLAIYDPHEGGE